MWRGEHPAEHDPGLLDAEVLAAQRDRRWHRGHPVEAVEHDEQEQARVHGRGRAGRAPRAGRVRGRSSSRTAGSGCRPGRSASRWRSCRRCRRSPISASRLALVVAGSPWSWAAGMKWVPISPLVDQPQIQNVPKRIQKVLERALSRSVRTATGRGARRRSVAGGGGCQSAGAPYGVVPTSVGRSRISSSTSGTSEQREGRDEARRPTASPGRRPGGRWPAGRPAGRWSWPRRRRRSPRRGA